MLSLNKKVITIGLITLGLSGCGGQAYRDAEDNGVSNISSNNTGTNFVSSGTSDSTEPTSSLPPELWDFSIWGSNDYTVPDGVTTDTILKIKVKAGPAGKICDSATHCTNGVAAYNWARYTVTVNGVSRKTDWLSSTGSGTTEQTIDFSDRLSTGHGLINVSVTKVETDAGCYRGMVANCWAEIYWSWTATGTLEITKNSNN